MEGRRDVRSSSLFGSRSSAGETRRSSAMEDVSTTNERRSADQIAESVHSEMKRVHLHVRFQIVSTDERQILFPDASSEEEIRRDSTRKNSFTDRISSSSLDEYVF